MNLLFLNLLVLLLVTFNDVNAEKSRRNIDPSAISELVDYLQQVLENFRSEMKIGIPELDISSLDPLPIDEKYFEINDAMAKGRLFLKQLFVDGLSTINPRIYHPSNDKLHVRFDLSTVVVRGHYDVDGKVAKIFPIYGRGPFTLMVSDPSAEVYGRFYMRGSRVHFEITDMTFDWRGLQLRLENFLGGGNLSAIVQRIIPVFAREIFRRMEPDIVEHMTNPLNARIDSEIVHKDIQDILKTLLNVQH